LADTGAFPVLGVRLDSAPRPPRLAGMSIALLHKRLSADRASFIEPCLPSPADKPPSGANWIHEIKHDGFRLRPGATPWASG
jgi:ATP-dependent DNA ligase